MSKVVFQTSFKSRRFQPVIPANQIRRKVTKLKQLTDPYRLHLLKIFSIERNLSLRGDAARRTASATAILLHEFTAAVKIDATSST